MSNLYLIYHVAFLSIFLGTAIVALGSVLKVSIFSRVEDKYTKVLFWTLIVELAGAVIQAYLMLPPIELNRAEEYAFELSYRNYLDDWRKSQSIGNQACINNYMIGGQVSDECNKIIEKYKTQERAINKTGKGKMFLSFNDRSGRYTGIVSYKFPDDKGPTVLDVTGEKVSDDIRDFLFTQYPRSIEIGGECVTRPSYQFEIAFSKDGQRFIGELIHPIAKINGKNIVLGSALIYPK